LRLRYFLQRLGTKAKAAGRYALGLYGPLHGGDILFALYYYYFFNHSFLFFLG
jgi:hypothetical protein